ncbi:MAG: TIR domain-containing protein, partial [Gammaproteobacteria bacterium]|nr:TIR domain-containing protein [Gammaproteobacteria bacterium]
MSHVFICYSREDFDFAELLREKIEAAGLKVWQDLNGLRAGEDWRDDIDQAIREAFALIAVMTPEANASAYVSYEWAFALGVGVKVFPVIRKPTELHSRLEGIQFLNFPDIKARPWDDLVEVLRDAQSHHTPSGIQRAINVDAYIQRIIYDYEFFEENRDNKRTPAIELMERDNLKAHYVSLYVRDIDGARLGSIDEFVNTWLEDSESNHLSILGDYGTGKSSFCLNLTYNLAKKYRADPVKNRIPIFISLSKHSRVEDLPNLIDRLFIQQYNISITYDDFHRLMTDGKVL